jgi:hypothetical protein
MIGVLIAVAASVVVAQDIDLPPLPKDFSLAIGELFFDLMEKMKEKKRIFFFFFFFFFFF